MAKKNRFSELKIISSLSDMQSICPENEYRILSSGEYPPDIPEALARKFNQAIMVASGSSHSVVYVVNGIRVDGQLLDEEPMIVAFDRETGEGYGGLIHHGGWPGRTSAMPKQMQDHVLSSGIENYFPLGHLPQSRSGSLEELMRSSQSASFWSAVVTLKKNDPEADY